MPSETRSRPVTAVTRVGSMFLTVDDKQLKLKLIRYNVKQTDGVYARGGVCMGVYICVRVWVWVRPCVCASVFGGNGM